MMIGVSIGKPGQSSYHGQTTRQEWDLDIPLYCHTDDWRDVDNERSSLKEKLDYRADRRNIAVKIALEKYPDTDYLMMIDTFYIGQSKGLRQLISRHSMLHDSRDNVTIGPAVWGRMRTNLSQIIPYHLNRQRFYDAWTTPDLRWCPRGWRPDRDILTKQEKMPLKGFYRVSSIGGCYIFPRSVWDKGARYSVPDDLHGCEHNGFHASYNLPKYIDFDSELYRVKKYGLIHCARCSIGNRIH